MQTRGVDSRRVRLLASAAILGDDAVVRNMCRTGMFLDTPCHWHDPHGIDPTGYPPGLHLEHSWYPFRKGTPLLWAALGGHEAAVRSLVVHGARVNATDSRGRDAMHYAAMLQHRGIAEFLMLHNANFSTLDRYGLTPLHYAATHFSSEMATLLIEHGASIDARHDDGDNETALYVASQRGRIHTVRMLLDNGAEFLEPCGRLDITPTAKMELDSLRIFNPDRVLHELIHVMLLAEPARREALRVAACEAFAMGHQERLGASSWVRGLDAGVIRMVLENL
jgi:Ankyrin repeats (3 copies)